MCSVYYNLGRTYDAIDAVFEARRIRRAVYGDNHPDTADNTFDIALLWQRIGGYDKALETYDEFLAISKNLEHQNQIDLGWVHNNIAAIHENRGNYDTAVENYEKALAIWRRVHGERHANIAFTLKNLSQCHAGRKDFAAAVRTFDDALRALGASGEVGALVASDRAAEQLSSLPLTVDVLRGRASAMEKGAGARPSPEALRECLKTCTLAAAVLDQLRGKVLESPESKLRMGSTHFELFPRYLHLCRLLHEQQPRDEVLDLAFTACEQASARVFLEALTKARAQIIGQVSDELRLEETQLLQRLKQTDARLESILAMPLDQRDETLLRPLIDAQKRDKAALEKLIRRMENQYPAFAALKYPRPISLEKARACLGDREVALLFVTGAEEFRMCLLLDNRGASRLVKLPPSHEIADLVAAITDEHVLASPTRVRSLGAEGFELLLAPLADSIRDKDLLIVPAGPLCFLPFELLVEKAAGRRGRFLIESHRVRYAPSLTTLHVVQQSKRARTVAPTDLLLAVGDPIYGPDDERITAGKDLAKSSRAALDEFLTRTRSPQDKAAVGRLRFSGQEVTRIRDILGTGPDSVLTGLQASEAAVKAASAKGILARARYVHFATHGMLGLDTGRQPSLLLNLVGNDAEDGFLQIDEVTQLKLNADLVVLSACETGKGQMHQGEGAISLARAFLYAGSNGVVCSLWAVDDAHTAELMADVYRQLKTGRNSADALREAQRNAIRAGKAPLFWAPFVFIGD